MKRLERDQLAIILAFAVFAITLMAAGFMLREVSPALFVIGQWPVIGLASVFFGLGLVVVAWHLVRRRSLPVFAATAGLLALTALVLASVLRGQPLGASWHEVVFQRNLPEYQEVVRLVEDGRVEVDDLYDQLPSEYSHIAAGGWIAADERETAVYFPVLLGVVDNSEGFAYWPSSTLPPGDAFDGFWIAEARQIRPNWFRVWMT